MQHRLLCEFIGDLIREGKSPHPIPNDPKGTSHRPELAFSQMHFEGVVTEGTAVPKLWFSKSHREDSVAPVVTSENVVLKIPLHNIGLGAAINVSITWSFQIELTVAHANASAKEAQVPANFTFENDMLSFASESLGSTASFWLNQRKSFLDFVLPSTRANEAIMLALPQAYVSLCFSLIYFESQRKAASILEWLPSLTLDVEYVDIDGNPYQVRFECVLSVSAILNKKVLASITCKKALNR